MDESERLEFVKLAELRHYGSLLRSLLEAVAGEYGLCIDDGVREVYRWVRDKILFLGNALDAEFEVEHDLNLGNLMELAMPEEIDDIDSGNNSFGYHAADFIKAVCYECDNMESIHPRLLFTADSDALKETQRASVVIERTREQQEVYVRALKSGIESSLFSLSVANIAKDLTFGFVDNDSLSSILCDRVEGAVAAYQSRRFLDAVTGCLSVVEGLLGFGLLRNAVDAQINYAKQHPDRRPLPHIYSWGAADLISTAKTVGLFRSQDLYKYCYRLNMMRNSVHVFNQLAKGGLSDRDALFGFVVMSWVHDEGQYWADMQTN